jgi:acyl-CoA synthetase (AMP-forming)/AMP-acid ligase II
VHWTGPPTGESHQPPRSRGDPPPTVVAEIPDWCAYDPVLDVDPWAPACVVFTSDSTGVPKEVVGSHRSVVRTFSGQSYVHFGQSDAFSQCGPV